MCRTYMDSTFINLNMQFRLNKVYSLIDSKQELYEKCNLECIQIFAHCSILHFMFIYSFFFFIKIKCL